jgi:CheY-like chemotaxis protein
MDETVLIAMMGYGHEQDRLQAQAASFNHHLVKPVDPAALQRVRASLGDR